MDEDTVFSLPLQGSHMPDDWVPLEAVVVAEFLDAEGYRRLYVCKTEGMSAWTAVGALMVARDSYRDHLKEELRDDGDYSQEG